MTNLVSDAQWRAALNAVGAEDFDTGRASYLRMKFVEEDILVQLGDFQVEDGTKVARCVTSDVALHDLVKGSAVRRVSDGAQYAVRRLDKRAGGTTLVTLEE